MLGVDRFMVWFRFELHTYNCRQSHTRLAESEMWHHHTQQVLNCKPLRSVQIFLHNFYLTVDLIPIRV